MKPSFKVILPDSVPTGPVNSAWDLGKKGRRTKHVTCHYQNSH